MKEINMMTTSIIRMVLNTILIATLAMSVVPTYASEAAPTVESNQLVDEPMVRLRIVDTNGVAVKNIRVVVKPLLIDSKVIRDEKSVLENQEVFNGLTDQNGEIQLNSSQIIGRNSSLELAFSIELKTHMWELRESVVSPSHKGVMSVVADRIPIIFVPGIMGSYLDYDNPYDGKKCNIWPTSSKFISLGACKGEFYKNQKKHSELLQQLDNKRIYPTDILREQSNHLPPLLADVYVDFINAIVKEWPEYGHKQGLNMAQTPIERCTEIKSLVDNGTISTAQTLFYPFGYDWRQQTKYNAEKLSEFINCVQSIHGTKVNLVGHSMGGLVIKQLLLNYKDQTDVQSVSTFNTPYLGSARAIQIMINGDYDAMDNIILDATYLKYVARKVPGALELLPSNSYLEEYPGVLVINGKPINQISKHWSVLTKLGNQVDDYKLDYKVGRDDLSGYEERTTNIDYLIQISSNSNNTINQIRLRSLVYDWGLFTKGWGAGDGTVNEFSLSRVNANVDWNPKSIPGKRRVITIGHCGLRDTNPLGIKYDGVNHSELVSYRPAILNYIQFIKYPSELRKNNEFTTCRNGKTVLSLGKPKLSYPDDGYRTNDGRWPILGWQPGNGVDSAPFGYRIQVSKYRDFRNFLVDECVRDEFYLSDNPSWDKLHTGTLYWRVNYVSESWITKLSCKLLKKVDSLTWSPVRSFTNQISTTTTSIRPITGVIKSIPRSDDGFSDEGPELGFTVNYYGQTYDYIYVNNNGNVSFNEPVYSYQSDAIRNNSYAMIAGFFADVDTRNSVSKTVQYGQSMVNRRKAFIANYLDVGYNNRKSDKLNRFQIVLIDRSDTGAGNFDIEFNYNKIVWETGDSNGGTNGFGGQSARVGFSSGQGDASYFELPGSSVPGRFLDRNTTAGLVNTSRGSGGVRGRYVVTVRNGIAVMRSTP